MTTRRGDGALDGAWVRTGRSLAGAQPCEPSEVVWLQVDRYFVDVRVARGDGAGTHPLDRSQAFSGTIDVEAGTVVFTHDIDTTDREHGHEDRAEVRRDRNVLTETGPGYREWWAARSASGAPRGVAERRSVPTGAQDVVVCARLLRVGELAAAAWSEPAPGGATYALGEDEAGVWVTVCTVGDPTGGEVGPLVARALVSGAALPGGWERVT